MKVMGIPILCLAFALAAGNLAVGDEDFTDAERRVLASLNSQTATSYLQSGDNALTVLESDQSQFFVFQKVQNRLPILGNVVTIFVDANGDVVRVIDDSTVDLTTGSREPKLDGTRAVELAEGTLTTLRAAGSSHEMVWFRRGNKAVLAWQVETNLEPSDAPVSPTHLYTVVDAISGEVLSQTQKDMNIYTADPETGKGVFPRRIVINDAVGPAGSQSFALGFPEVCDIPGCTATLIASNVLISARHCGVSVGGTVNFGSNSAAPVFSTTVQSVSLPAGAGSLLDGGDVAIVVLNANVPGGVATPMRFIDETTGLVGMTASTVGYGLNGVGSTGHMGTSDGLRWGGQNVIDVFGTPASESGTNIISTDFDDGSNANNTIPGSSPTPLALEATTAPGDSGGPIIVNVGGENLIAGVLSGGTDPNSVFGDISWWTGTADFRSQIEAAGGQFSDGTMPPPNDNFINTIFLGGFPFNTMGTNVDATTEPGEQQLENTGATVWWFFTAPEDGMVTIDTFGSDFDTVLHIYEGFFPGATVADLIPVVDNDDSGGTLQSQVSFAVNSGDCYEVRVGGFSGVVGDISLNGTFAPTGVLLGDVNLDGSVNLLDVSPFVNLITSGTFQAEADINGDGFVNLLDVSPFVVLLTDG